MRTIFVIGAGPREPDAHADDVLVAPLPENTPVGNASASSSHDLRRGLKLMKGANTWSLYSKEVAFLKYAARAEEPFVAKGDDDTFVQPSMLSVYVRLLLEMSARERNEHLLAGVFEYFSFRPASLESVAWGRTRLSASWGVDKSFGTPAKAGCGEYTCPACSPHGGGWRWDGWEIREKAAPPMAAGAEPNPNMCFGPLAFPKGPLKFMSAAAVRWLVNGPAFERDVRYAERLRLGDPALPPAGGDDRRVSADVQLGYWFASHPTMALVRLKQWRAWYDNYHHITDLRHLLSVHRVPYDMFGWLLRHTEALWRDAAARNASLRVMSQCSHEPPCDARFCAHAAGQRVCTLYAELPPSAAGSSASAVCRGPKSDCTCVARTASGAEATGKSAYGCASGPLAVHPQCHARAPPSSPPLSATNECAADRAMCAAQVRMGT